jgi:anti-sigma factor RsiW
MNESHHDHRECIKLFARLSEYLDNELDLALCRKIEQHLGQCKPCQVCLETLKRTIGICRASNSAPVPDSLSERLQKLFSR